MHKVYKHTAPNGKVYIGVTHKDITKRWGKNGLGYNSQQLFYRAIKKYGWDNIKHEILADNLTKEQAYQLEVKFIAKYKANNPKYGYNCSAGGEYSHYGCKASPELKQKLSAAHKGLSLTQEQKEGLKKAQERSREVWKNRKHTDEAKHKMSEAHKGKIPWNKGLKGVQISPNKGKRLSPEVKDKIRQTLLQRNKEKRANL